MSRHFNYYYGSQADQFSFIRIPKIMLTDKSFAALSLQAKVLYGVLLDRMSLSRKNGWLDAECRVFIIYQIGEIQKDLGFSKKKAIDFLAELEKFGLVEKKRRGHGLPNILYVKSFMSDADAEEDDTSAPEQEDTGSRSSQKDTSGTQGKGSQNDGSITPGTDVADHRGAENDTSISEAVPACREKEAEREVNLSSGEENTNNLAQEGLFFEESEVPKLAPQEVPKSTLQEVPKSILQEVSKSTPQEVPKSTLQEVPKSTPLKSKTEINNTELNNIESNHIVSSSVEVKSREGRCDAMRCDTMRSEESPTWVAKEYRKMIQENICFDQLLAGHANEDELLEGILDLILETVMCRSEQILIASNTYPTELVRSKFLKLGYWHIEYVLNCLKANTTRVKNIKKYLLAALFNAPSTIEGYYTAEVNYCMPEFASGR